MQKNRVAILIDDFACSAQAKDDGDGAREDHGGRVIMLSSRVLLRRNTAVCYSLADEPAEGPRDLAEPDEKLWGLEQALRQRPQDSAPYYCALFRMLLRKLNFEPKHCEIAAAIPYRNQDERTQVTAAVGLACLALGVDRFAISDAHRAAAEKFCERDDVRESWFAACVPWRRGLSFMYFHTRDGRAGNPVPKRHGANETVFARQLELALEEVFAEGLWEQGLPAPTIGQLIALYSPCGHSLPPLLVPGNRPVEARWITSASAPTEATLQDATTTKFDQKFAALKHPSVSDNSRLMSELILPDGCSPVQDFHLVGAIGIVRPLRIGLAGHAPQGTSNPTGLARWLNPIVGADPQLFADPEAGAAFTPDTGHPAAHAVESTLNALHDTWDKLDLEESRNYGLIKTVSIDARGNGKGEPATQETATCTIDGRRLGATEARRSVVVNSTQGINRTIQLAIHATYGGTVNGTLTMQLCAWDEWFRGELDTRLTVNGDLEFAALVQGRVSPLIIAGDGQSTPALRSLEPGRYRLQLDLEHELRVASFAALRQLAVDGVFMLDETTIAS